MKKITDHAAVLEAVAIEPVDISGEFARIASLLATYNEEYSKALSEHLRHKAAREREYSRAYLKYRTEGLELQEKITEGVIKARVVLDKGYILANERAAAAEVEKVRLSGVLDALSTKRDALISLGAHLRAEMGGSPVIRSRDHDYQGDNFEVAFDLGDDKE